MHFLTARQLDYVTVREAKGIGTQFAQWLNITGGTKLVFRLLEIEKQIQDLDNKLEQYVSHLPDHGPESDDVSDEMSERLDSLIAEFNKLMSRCKVYPRLIDLDFWQEGFRFRWDLVRAPRKALKRSPRRPKRETCDDLDALFAIVRLAQFGYLSRLKKCPCGEWFYDRMPFKQFCSGKCRQKMFSQSEKFRAHRREYMRRYYRLKVSGVVK